MLVTRTRCPDCGKYVESEYDDGKPRTTLRIMVWYSHQCGLVERTLGKALRYMKEYLDPFSPDFIVGPPSDHTRP